MNRRGLIALVCAGLAGAAGCGENFPPGLSEELGFSAVVFIKHSSAPNAGVLATPFEDRGSGKLVRLSPAAQGGTQQVLVEAEGGAVHDFEIAPSGDALVFSARLDATDSFHIYLLDLRAIERGESCLAGQGDLGPACRQLTFGPADDFHPFFLADGKVAFFRSHPLAAMDFQGRGAASQLWAVEGDGSGLYHLEAVPGNILSAAVMGDGRLQLIRWTVSSGRAVFQQALLDPPGGEQTQILAGDLSPIPLGLQRDENHQLYAACTAPLGTWGAGAACRLEDNGWQQIIPGMISGEGCSAQGRIRDPYPLRDGRLLATLAQTGQGCVNASDQDRGQQPDFSLSVLTPGSNQVLKLLNTQEADLMPRPIMPRRLLDVGHSPPMPPAACAEGGVVFEGWARDEKGARLTEAVRVRALEALDGSAVPWRVELGGEQASAICASANSSAVPVLEDGSFALRLPAVRPVRLQLLDSYGAALATDALWWSGPDCARRSCSGCHAGAVFADMENSLAHGQTPQVLSDRQLQRVFDFRRDIQPVLDRSCAVKGCHDSTTAAGTYVSLSGSLIGLDLSGSTEGRATRAYNQLLLVDVVRDNNSGRILQSRRPYVVPGRARESRLLQRLGVPCRYDCQGKPAWAPWGVSRPHPEDQPSYPAGLTNDERWLLVEWVDAGAPFVGRGSTP